MSDTPCQFPMYDGFCGKQSDRFFYMDSGDENRSSTWSRCQLHCHEAWAAFEVPFDDYLALEVLGS